MPLPSVTTSILFLPGSEPPPPPSIIGGKAYQLALLCDAGERVPPFFVLRTTALQDFLAGIRTGQSICRHIETAPFDPSLREAIHAALSNLKLQDEPLAVRSSAVEEDGAVLSYAGQLESVLGVGSDRLDDAIRAVWLSSFSDRLAAYRRESGVETDGQGVAVIVQQLVDADVSGVAFGVNPVSGADEVVISAVFGLGEGLVGGELDADTWRVEDTIIERRIVPKTHKRIRSEKGTTALSEVPESLRNEPALDDAMIREIAALTQRLGLRYGAPQDVEWCVADGRLFLLQCRPVTAVGSVAGSDGPARPQQDGPAAGSATIPGKGERVLWDNSNIIESYSGITTPLTFSFIREVYTEVYSEFCRIMGVDEETIRRNRDTFEMLGLIRGRVYYNLLNWYRMLALLPGYSINARFMEQMMGVREKLEETPKIHRSSSNPYLRLGISIYRLLGNLISLRGNIARFYQHLDETLAPLERSNLVERSPSELIALYRMLEQSLLQRWRVPILNDFYTMIFFGLLKSRIESWGVDRTGTLHNDLLAGEGGIVSTEPMRLLREISNRIVHLPELAAITIHGSHGEFQQALHRHPDIAALVGGYLQRFGDRYVGELKLESITPRHRPALMQTMLAGYVQQGEVDPESERRYAVRLRREAETTARRNVRGAVRSALFTYLLDQTRERVKNRENLRFERTRVFGVVRRIFLALGEHLAESGAIDSPRDIFLLTKEEIFGWTIGASASGDLKGLIEARRAEFRRFESMKMPDRFETCGFPHTFDPVTDPGTTPSISDDDMVLHGLACCPGIVRATVRVVTDPTTASPLAGAILVAERTDPGWAPLFPAASGLLVERGSLLSHSAIVAREMGIPAIVAIPGLMERLHDGMLVEMDGAAGTIRIIDEGSDG